MNSEYGDDGPANSVHIVNDNITMLLEILNVIDVVKDPDDDIMNGVFRVREDPYSPSAINKYSTKIQHKIRHGKRRQ